MGRSRVSAITQTPASGPSGPVTTPAMSSASIGIAPPGACAARIAASDRVAAATPAAAMRLEDSRMRFISNLLDIGTPATAGLMMRGGSVSPGS